MPDAAPSLQRSAVRVYRAGGAPGRGITPSIAFLTHPVTIRTIERPESSEIPDSCGLVTDRHDAKCRVS
jgi:hypothetical protein